MTQPTDIVERCTSDLERIQEGNRPLPWVVHSGCSYRRIASQPTRENGYMSFRDGNVLHAYRPWPGNHPDLSMGEEQLEALVRLINGCPDLLAEITRLRERLEVVPGWSEDVDGIGCRDETIRLQDERIERLRTKLTEAHLRGVKAGLDAWNHWYDRATADDDCEYLNGEGWDDAAKLRAIDPASVATPDA